jgi:hypothetical protein
MEMPQNVHRKIMKMILRIYIALLLFSCTPNPTEKRRQITKSIKTTTIYLKAPAYKSFSQFKNDTLHYLEYNFEQRKHYYTDRPLGFLLKELELPVFSYHVSQGYKFKGGCDPSPNDSIASISFTLEKEVSTFEKFDRRIRPNVLVVKLKPFQADSALLLSKKYGQTKIRWSKEVGNYYADKTIEEVLLIQKSPTK